MECIYCGITVQQNFDNVDKHLQYGHGIANQRPILVSIFLLSQSEISEFLDITQSRYEGFKSTGQIRVITHDKKPSEINEKVVTSAEKETNNTSKDDIEVLTIDDDSEEEDDPMLSAAREILLKEEADFVDDYTEYDDNQKRSIPNTIVFEIPNKGVKNEPIEPLPPINEEIEESEKETEKVKNSDKNADNADKNKINLVEKFFKLKQCKLCYIKFTNEDNLKRHEEVSHKEHQSELSLTHFTLEDLKYPCSKCPGLKYLTENILTAHMKIQHKVQEKVIKQQSFQCKLCYTTLSSNQILKVHQEKKHKQDLHFLDKDIEASFLMFNCLQCEKKFVSQAVLDYHQNVHKLEGFQFLKIYCIDKKTKVYQCPLCLNKVIGLRPFIEHAKAYHKDEFKYFKTKPGPEMLTNNCKDCNLQFVTENCFKLHWIREHVKKSKNCNLCEKEFKSINGAFNHRLKFHNDELDELNIQNISEKDKKLQCKRCKTKFPTEGSIAYHEMKVHGIRRNKKITKKKVFSTSGSKIKHCKLCYKEFKKSGNLKAHMNTVHNDEKHFVNKEIQKEDLKFHCKYCEKKFVSEKSLKHHNNANPVMTCKFCKESFEGKLNFEEHCKTKHGKQDELLENGLIKCMLCSKKVKSSSMKNHKISHGSMEQCPLCYKEYQGKINLRSHIKTIHKSLEEKLYLLEENKDDLKFNCEKCDLKFLTKFLLSKHNKSQHNILLQKNSENQDRKNIFCNLCLIQFPRTKILKEHQERVHVSEIEKSLIGNEEIKHSLLKVKCQFCENKFVNKSSMKYHRKFSHKGAMKKDKESEISCEFCNKMFKWKNRKSLKMHIKNIHNLDDYDVTEHIIETPETNAANNFMDLLNSL